MAIYRLEAKIFGRERRERSVIAAAAYRAGKKLKDEVRDKIFDYSRKAKGVVSSTILTPEDAPLWTHDTSQLWNKVEAGEKRVDAQLAREFILAVPRELSKEAQFELAVDWAKKELVSKGMVVEVSLHHPRGNKNPHVHLLCTMRKLDGDGFSKKKSREWNETAVLDAQRESWCVAENAALEKAGRPERVSHRSLADQGIDREPQPKIGAAATAMARRGEDTDRFREVRRVNLWNAVRPFVRAIQNYGEVKPLGMGNTWWQKSAFLVSRIKARAQDAVKNTWAKMINSQRNQETKKSPEQER